MSALAVIPARLAASRFPGKPLADLHGLPMVMHCYFRTCLSELIDRAVVATCDPEIADVAQRFGAPVVMTSERHLNAVDRAAEAVRTIKATSAAQPDIIVLVQGDEPLLNPETIDLLVSTITAAPTVDVLNVMVPFASYEDFLDRNSPKVVVDANGDALYMSREAIPSAKHSWDSSIAHMQTGLFAFRPAALQLFAETARTALEAAESIDMLRVLHSGRKVRMLRADERTIGVDTPQDLIRVHDLLYSDRVFPTYREFDREPTAD